MKRFLLVLTVLTITLFGTTTLAAEKTDAYNKLLGSIINSWYDQYNDLNMIDVYGNKWKSDSVVGKENNEVLSVYTMVYDYDTAKHIYDRLGGDIYYDVPITLTKENDFYDIVVIVYKGTNVNLLCSRPTELYSSGYKVLGSWNSKNTDLIMFKTDYTSSFRCNIELLGTIEGWHIWGNGFYPEEEANLNLYYENKRLWADDSVPYNNNQLCYRKVMFIWE